MGRVMPDIINQISGYWADMAREGVKKKIVLRGPFSDRRTKRAVMRVLLDDLPEVVRGCDDTCEWEDGITTAQTIMGEFVSPPKARRRLGGSLEDLLIDAGFEVNVVLEQSAIIILELQ